MKLYVEGGGDAAALQIECRAGFTNFITKAGLIKRPRIVACGSRRDAYESFCTSIAAGDAAMLLVDSETPVVGAHQLGDPETWLPWAHLKNRPGDEWEKPLKSEDSDCHLMVQTMENWFLADRDTLIKFFNNGFREKRLPAASRPVQEIPKQEVFTALENATADCEPKGSYEKGKHSFKLLQLIQPATVIGASGWARRFIRILKTKMDE